MRALFLLITIMSYTSAVLRFQLVGFNSTGIKIVLSALQEWNRDQYLVEAGQSDVNRIVNASFDATLMSLAFTQTRLYTNNKLVDIVIDATRCQYANVMYNVLLHELGHSIGLKHNNDARSIMNATIIVDQNNNARNVPKRRLGLVDRCAAFQLSEMN